MYVTSPVSLFESNPPFPAHLPARTPSGRSPVSTILTGRSLFCEGDEADFVYEVLEGVVCTSKLLCDGRRQIITFGYPGDIIGLSHDATYHCDCEALVQAKVKVYRRNAFSASYDTESDFCDRLLQHAASEVNSMQEHFVMLGRKSSMEKLASFLVVLVDRIGDSHDGRICFEMPMKRIDIADFLALTMETVSRTLSRLRRDGIITLPSPKRICVLKPDALRALADPDI